jgi:hypothetical protein
MSARYVAVPAAAIRNRLAAAGFRLLAVPLGCPGEEVYERRHDRDPRYAVKVYSSIQRGQEEVRDRGADAIRVVAVYYGGPLGASGEWLGGPGAARGIFKSPRVHRSGSVDSVLDRMIDRAREAYAFINSHRGRAA